MFERCPASALRCVVPGLLGDASGSFSLVLASVNVISVVVVSGLTFTMFESVVWYVTGCFRVVCECITLCVRCINIVQKVRIAQNDFLSEPLRGVGRASTR